MKYSFVNLVNNNYTFPADKNPATKLQIMIGSVVMELQSFPKNSDLHLNLAYLLEEKFMLEDTMNIKFECVSLYFRQY